jgi:hypothetical protein
VRGYVSSLLTRRQVGHVRVIRRDGPALGRYYGSSAIDARGLLKRGHIGALEEVVCCYPLFSVMIRRQKCWFWSTIMPVELAEVARHPYCCRIIWMYLSIWMALDMRGLMALRPYARSISIL